MEDGANAPFDAALIFLSIGLPLEHVGKKKSKVICQSGPFRQACHTLMGDVCYNAGDPGRLVLVVNRQISHLA